MPPASASPPSGPAFGTWLHWAIPLVLTTLACLAAGFAALGLTIPPGYASALNPAAGIALACTLVHGRWMLVGIAVAAAAVQWGSGTAAGPHGADAVLPLAVGAGAALQAFVGARLVARHVGEPLLLTQPRDVARFFAACAVASLIAASVGTLTLAAGSALAESKLTFTWLTWWIGDIAGLLIVTPVVLTIIGRPRSEWAPRRVPVGVTMTLVVAFLALGILQAARWNEERLRSAFDHDASGASLILATQLQEPLRALEALRGVVSVSRSLGQAEMQVATQNWLGGGAVRAMGWSEKVRKDDIAAFQARARGEGSTGFHVFDRDDESPAASAVRPATAGFEPGDVVAIRHIEPMQGNASALGVNALSIPAARAAVSAAIDSGRPAASARFRLTQQAPEDKDGGVVIYQAVYDRAATSPEERRAALRGVVFVALSMDTQLQGLSGKVPAYLGLCVVDRAQLTGDRRLAGAAGCDRAMPALVSERPLLYAGRQWDLRAVARPEDLPDAADRSAWVFCAVGVLSAAMLAASLLITTGRTRRIESAVRERTAALRAEVGERHLAEQALRASEQRFRNILDNVPIGVVYTDLSRRIIQANPRFCELTGCAESELAALAAAELTHPDDVAGEAALTTQLIAGAIPMYRSHRRLVAKDGTIVWVRGTVSMLRDAKNEPWRIVGVVEDITEHLRLEEAEQAREVAEAANRAKSEFLSRMSHELRTPLNAMLGFAQLLEIDQRHPLAPAQRPWVGQIQQAGWHLLAMINDVLDLSRIEADNLRLQMATLDLPEIVGATLALVAADAARRGIVVSQDLAPGTSLLVGDATRAKQILTNLLSNAVKYNVEGGRIHVASRLASAEMVELSVTDTGLGLTPEQMDQLFRPFNRLGRERTSLQGTGIGLVISRRLAELMGGSIRVKSVPGEGSSFILRLPRAVDADTVRSKLHELGGPAPEYHRRIVHYVEDNETNVEVMRGILAQRPQVQLEVSVAGLDGLAAIRARMPHLLLLDMHLPDISGLELLRHLKADPVTAGILVIAVSADATAQQIDAALDAGAVRYLTKPVDVTELLAAVDELLDRMDTGFS